MPAGTPYAAERPRRPKRQPSRAAAAARRLIKREEARHRPEPIRESRPARLAPPVSLSPTRTGTVTDQDVGLIGNQAAQEAAERYLRNVYAFQLREAEKAARAIEQAVNIEIPAESVSITASAEEPMSSDDAMILSELRRLEKMPLPRWMRVGTASAA